MDHVDTGTLCAPAAGWPAGWKLAFEIIVTPIRWIIRMRDLLTTDFRRRELNFWIPDLHTYDKLMYSGRQEIVETLSVLDSVGASKTWDVGHMIQNAVTPVECSLSRIKGITFKGRGQPYTDAEILDVRKRVFDASTQFTERPLLEALRIAVREEVHILIERQFLNYGSTNSHFGIAAPSAPVEAPLFPEDHNDDSEASNAMVTPAGDDRMPANRRLAKLEWLAKAMLTVREHPEWSDAAIAEEVGVHKGTLSRSPEYQMAANLAREPKKDLPKGHVDIDPETRKRRGIEAYDDADDAGTEA